MSARPDPLGTVDRELFRFVSLNAPRPLITQFRSVAAVLEAIVFALRAIHARLDSLEHPDPPASRPPETEPTAASEDEPERNPERQP